MMDHLQTSYDYNYYNYFQKNNSFLKMKIELIFIWKIIN